MVSRRSREGFPADHADLCRRVSRRPVRRSLGEVGSRRFTQERQHRLKNEIAPIFIGVIPGKDARGYEDNLCLTRSDIPYFWRFLLLAGAHRTPFCVNLRNLRETT